MKQRLNVSLESELVAQARKMLKARHFSNLSSYIEHLVREEFEKTTAAAPSPNPAGPASSQPAHGRASYVPERGTNPQQLNDNRA